MAAVTAGVASLLSNMRLPPGVNPLEVRLPPPPKLEGALKPNNVLTKAIRYGANIGTGPESMVIYKGFVYSGYQDGWVREIDPRGRQRYIRRMSMPTCGTRRQRKGDCGRPLGMRAMGGLLYVADPYNGIIRLNTTSRAFEHVVNTRGKLFSRRPLWFVNDLAIARNGTIYFTSSSSKYQRDKFMDVILEGERTGRVMVYDPESGKIEEMVTNLGFANGLELSADEDYLLIGEGSRARIFKAYIKKGRGVIETFAENLPGFVDNIRRTSRGTYWVGLSSIRHAGSPSLLDKYNSTIRGYIMGMSREEVMKQAPKHGIAVELDKNGKILRSIQDPTGNTFTSVSEVEEFGDYLYIGSDDRNYIGIIKKADLPPEDLPTDPGQDQGADSIEQQLANFLRQFDSRIMPWDRYQLRPLVLRLVENLIRAKLEAFRLLEEVKELRRQVAQGGTTTAAPTTTTTSAMEGDATASSSTTDATTATSTSSSSAAAAASETTESASSTTTPAAPTGSATTPSSDTTTDSTTAADSGAADTTTQAASSDSSTTSASSSASGTTSSSSTSSGGDTTAATGSMDSTTWGSQSSGSTTDASGSSSDGTTAASTSSDSTASTAASDATTDGQKCCTTTDPPFIMCTATAGQFCVAVNAQCPNDEVTGQMCLHDQKCCAPSHQQCTTTAGQKCVPTSTQCLNGVVMGKLCGVGWKCCAAPRRQCRDTPDQTCKPRSIPCSNGQVPRQQCPRLHKCCRAP